MKALRFSRADPCPCRGKAEVVLGDGRLDLERESAKNYDLLVADAFSSDAVLVHLLTK